MRVVRCDNCKEEIKSFREQNQVHFRNASAIISEYDLCQICFDTIEGAIKQVKK